MVTAKRRRKPGPQPDRLIIEGDWGDAMAKALTKQRPADGWPHPPKRKPRRKPTKAKARKP